MAYEEKSKVSSFIDSVVGGTTSASRVLYEKGRIKNLRETLSRDAAAKTVLNGGYSGKDVVMSPHIQRMLEMYTVASTGRVVVLYAPADTGKTKAAEFCLHGRHPYRPNRSLMISAAAMEDFPSDFSSKLGVASAGPNLSESLCSALARKPNENPSSTAELVAKSGDVVDTVLCLLEDKRSFDEKKEIKMYGRYQIPDSTGVFEDMPVLIIDNFNRDTDKNVNFATQLLQEASQFGVFVFILTSNKAWATTVVGLNGGSKIKPLYGNVDNTYYESTGHFSGVPNWNTLPWPAENLRELVRPKCKRHGVDLAAVIPDCAEMTPVEAGDKVLRLVPREICRDCGAAPVDSWEALVNSLNLHPTGHAQLLLSTHGDTSWDNVGAALAVPYQNDNGQAMSRIIDAVPGEYVLVVKANNQVQALYGIKRMHALAENRVLGLGGDYVQLTPGIEGNPSLMSMHHNVNAQPANFASADVAAQDLASIVAHFVANPGDILSDPEPAPASGGNAPTIATRRALRVHPRLALLFLTERSPLEAALMVDRLLHLNPAIPVASLAPLERFMRAAATRTGAGDSALRSTWGPFSHTTNGVVVPRFFASLLGRHAPRASAPAPAPPPRDPCLWQMTPWPSRLCSSSPAIPRQCCPAPLIRTLPTSSSTCSASVPPPCIWATPVTPQTCRCSGRPGTPIGPPPRKPALHLRAHAGPLAGRCNDQHDHGQRCLPQGLDQP